MFGTSVRGLARHRDGRLEVDILVSHHHHGNGIPDSCFDPRDFTFGHPFKTSKQIPDSGFEDQHLPEALIERDPSDRLGQAVFHDGDGVPLARHVRLSVLHLCHSLPSLLRVSHCLRGSTRLECG